MNLRNVVSGCLNTASQWTKEIIVPSFVSGALHLFTEMALKDSRIAKIVGGTSLVIDGTYVMTRALKPWFFSNMNPEGSRVHVISRLGSLAIGATAACLGASLILQGASELYSEFNREERLPPSQKTLSEMIELPCDERLKLAQEKLLFCPDAEKIWEKVEDEGPFSIVCGETAMGAKVDTDIRRITIDEKISYSMDMTGNALFFELNNLAIAKQRNLQVERMCNSDADTYATQSEELERGTLFNFHDVTDRCVSAGFWNGLWPIYQTEFPRVDLKGGELDHESMQVFEQNGHTDLYRRQWYRKCVSTDEDVRRLLLNLIEKQEQRLESL